MLRELVEAARRFKDDGALPLVYARKHARWIIEVDGSGRAALFGPFDRNAARQLSAPDRYRSGKIGVDNLKPYLLLDDARYALGIPERGKAEEAALAHRGFVELVQEAAATTGEAGLQQIAGFLARPLAPEVARVVQPRDWVTFSSGPDDFPTDRPPVQAFWADHVRRKVLANTQGQCAACGRFDWIVQTMPKPVRILGQDCQITSFEQLAFRSLGKEQTTNAPLCFPCAARAIQALDYLVASDRHAVVLSRDDRRGEGRNPLRNQLGVFWLKQPQQVWLGDGWVDLEGAVAAALSRPVDTIPVEPAAPRANLAQLEALLKVPWTGQGKALWIDTNSFYLAVLSANKGRLAVREWVATSLADLRVALTAFLDALRVADAGGVPKTVPVPTLLAAVASENPGLLRGLLRTAYLGFPPPRALLEAAVLRFRLPATLKAKPSGRPTTGGSAREALSQDERLHALVAAMKLVLTYGKEDGHAMETLDRRRHVPAYLCGRLLAVLEEAQLRASRSRLNTTLVDRFYGAASSAPATAFGPLIRQSATAHLPKIRRNQHGYGRVSGELEEVLDALDRAGGFPPTLSLPQQAEFALGFYHERVLLHGEHGQQEQETGAAEPAPADN